MAVPELLEAFFVGVAVLHDERADPVGMLEGEAPAHRGAIVHHVHGVALDGQLIEQAVDQLVVEVETLAD